MNRPEMVEIYEELKSNTFRIIVANALTTALLWHVARIFAL
jgi:hypothetical protein